MEFPVQRIRSHFPALASGDVFFDGPGGTQVPQTVIDAIVLYYGRANANEHGNFPTSRRSDAIIAQSRAAMADFFNARSAREIIFGANMTTLTLQLSRALGRTLKRGDEIVLSRLDHDANIAPWLFLREKGVKVRWLEINAEDCTLKLDALERVLNKRTRIVAVGYASNAFGTINDVPRIVAAAREYKALTFVDAVHYAPHRPIDVQLLDCDFLACSPYKFYGPHAGVLYGKQEALERLQPYKVRPASDLAPDCFETGTKNHEGIAGIAAAVDFLAALGRDGGEEHGRAADAYPEGRRRWLKAALGAIAAHEASLFTRLLEGLQTVPGLRLYGIGDRERLAQRTPTACFTLPGQAPAEIAGRLGEAGIYVWDGNYYALEPMTFLRLEEQGGAVRAGICMYNTAQEVDRFLAALRRIAGGE
jgi:cysteine desulfurase family protein (TIGR01976 family)